MLEGVAGYCTPDAGSQKVQTPVGGKKKREEKKYSKIGGNRGEGEEKQKGKGDRFVLEKEKPTTVVRVKNERKNEEKVFELIKRNKSFCITILLARK